MFSCSLYFRLRTLCLKTVFHSLLQNITNKGFKWFTGRKVCVKMYIVGSIHHIEHFITPKGRP